MKFILGKKLVMTQVFKADGTVVPVTAVLAEPNFITQVKNLNQDKYSAIQVGFGRAKRMKKPQAGHLKGLEQVATIKEFRLPAEEAAGLERGNKITVSVFQPGDEIQVSGVSKGRGFQGVVKRHGFHGSPKTHGHKDQLRMPGSIGATDAARVFKGKRMAGHMGQEQVTIQGLEVVEIAPEKNILYVKGAVPGARNGLLLISGAGAMNLKAAQPEAISAAEVEAKEQPVAEAAETKTDEQK